MPMDTPSSGESNASLSVRDAAALFLAPEPEKKEPEAKTPEPAKVEPEKVPEATQATTEDAKDPDEGTPEVEMVEVDIDGFKVQVPKDKAEKLEKDRLRQADYTRKTMATAEERKAAEAETSKAREERQRYAQGLQQASVSLAAALQEQDKIDWEALRKQDFPEYLNQRDLQARRQDAFRKNAERFNEVAAQDRAEAKKSLVTHLQSEYQALLDKLPEWKDEKKASAEREAIVAELVERGFDGRRIIGETDSDGTPKLDNPGLTDHKLLLLARDAMLYRKVMSNARAAEKKVSNLPQKVEKPGSGDTSPTDGRTAAMKRLSQTGSTRDAAAVFAQMFK